MLKDMVCDLNLTFDLAVVTFTIKNVSRVYIYIYIYIY